MPATHKPTILLQDWTGTTLHATGVTLIFEELKQRPLLLVRCKGVTWDGGTLRLAQPSFTQGRVTSVGSNPLGGYCNWKVDAGYVNTINPARETFDVVDPTTRRLKVGTGDFGTSHADHTGPACFVSTILPGVVPISRSTTGW